MNTQINLRFKNLKNLRLIYLLLFCKSVPNMYLPSVTYLAAFKEKCYKPSIGEIFFNYLACLFNLNSPLSPPNLIKKLNNLKIIRKRRELSETLSCVRVLMNTENPIRMLISHSPAKFIHSRNIALIHYSLPCIIVHSSSINKIKRFVKSSLNCQTQQDTSNEFV